MVLTELLDFFDSCSMADVCTHTYVIRKDKHVNKNAIHVPSKLTSITAATPSTTFDCDDSDKN